MLSNSKKYCEKWPDSFFTPHLQKLIKNNNLTIHSFFNTFIPILKNHYENYLNGKKTKYILFKKMVTVLFLFNYILPDIQLRKYIEDVTFDFLFSIRCIECTAQFPIAIDKCVTCDSPLFQIIIPFSIQYNAYLNTTYSGEWVVNGEELGFCNYFKKK